MIEKFFTYTMEIHNNIQNYIKKFVKHDNDLLPRILQDEKSRTDTLPAIGPEVGKLSGLLIRLINAKRVLEFGTCLGYSTIWLAEAVKATGGSLVSVEYEKKFFNKTQENLAGAGLSSYVELIHGDANKIIHELSGPFDVIFQDSDKELYPVMLERCIQLVRKNGLLITDDALFKPMGVPAHLCTAIEEFNSMVFNNPRLYSTILPIGDGVVLSVKL
ncbi:MAG: O-methyltransferase [Spirochaetales bacterium]|nr:O-methyltransferase [Spirochaetales bacterium]